MAMVTNNYPSSNDETMNVLNTFVKMNEGANYKTEGTEVAFCSGKGPQ